MCVSGGINIHANFHMNMVIGLPRSINVNISISISINISISISIMPIRISLNISVISEIKTGISRSIQKIINVSTSIGNNY